MPVQLPLLLAAGLLPPVLILILCIVAGIGTVLLLPGRREAAVRKIGGAIVLAAALVFAAVLIRQTAQSAGDVYFWIFALVALVGAIRVISHPKLVYSALYFVLTVAASAGLFVLLWAEFMAAALVLIYAGAILVTYVFVIMLAQQVQSGGLAGEASGADYDRFSREPLAATATGFIVMAVLVMVIFDAGAQVPRAADAGFSSTMRGLGEYLFTRQLAALEVAAVLLTLAMVGAIIIARRRVPAEPGGAAPLLEFDPGESDPHKIPVIGTRDPKAKAYPES